MRLALLILALLASLGPAGAQSLSARDRASPEAFTAAMAAAIRAAYPGRNYAVAGPLTLRAGDSQVNLDRVYLFCQRNPAGCDDEARNLVARVRDMEGPPRGTVHSPAQLRLVVRARASVEELRRIAAGNPDWAVPVRPFGADLWLVLAIDLPTTIQMANLATLRAMGLEEEEALARARLNTIQALPPLDPAPFAGKPNLALVTGDPYDSSRLLDHAGLGALARAAGGWLVAGVPGDNALLLAGGGDDSAIAPLRQVMADLMKRARRPISAALFRWTPDGWQPLPP
jgi:hypothetical protein